MEQSLAGGTPLCTPDPPKPHPHPLCTPDPPKPHPDPLSQAPLPEGAAGETRGRTRSLPCTQCGGAGPL